MSIWHSHSGDIFWYIPQGNTDQLWRPFGPAFGHLGVLDVVLHALRPHDPGNAAFDSDKFMIPLLVPEILPGAFFCDEGHDDGGIGYSSSWMSLEIMFLYSLPRECINIYVEKQLQ